jgi:hypothetical protein
MKRPIFLKAIFISTIIGICTLVHAQQNAEVIKTPAAKPFKILSNGKQFTIQAKQNLKSVMVWTASGHRIVEQKEINATSYTFTVTIKEKVFFLLLETSEGKRYTEKLGIH